MGGWIGVWDYDGEISFCFLSVRQGCKVIEEVEKRSGKENGEEYIMRELVLKTSC